MKIIHFFVFTLLFLTSCQAQDKSKTIASTKTGNKIEIIDFHTTHRCKTCLKIEDNIKKLLQSDFKKEIDAGTMSLLIVDIDKEANYKMAERFEAASTAIFINVIKDGKEKHIDLTNFAFLKAFNDKEFAAELKAKINEQLKTL